MFWYDIFKSFPLFSYNFFVSYACMNCILQNISCLYHRNRQGVAVQRTNASGHIFFQFRESPCSTMLKNAQGIVYDIYAEIRY